MNRKDKYIIGIVVSLIVSSCMLMGLLFLIDPISVKQNQFTFELHAPIPTSAKDYLKANDNVLKDAVVNLSNVNIEEVGVYEAYAEYSGKQYPFTINIRDSVAPIASLVQTKYEIKEGETLIAKDLVKDIEEESDFIVYFDEEGNPSTKQFNDKGIYNDVFIIVEDAHGNRSNKLRLSVVVSKDSEGPIFSGIDNKVIKVGDAFGALDGVRATDKTDGDLTTSINVTGVVDVDKVGTYTLTYTVSDLSGNITSLDRQIIVQIEEVNNGDSVQDVANGPWLSKEKMRQLENTYLTISRAMFTGSSHLEVITQMSDYLVKYTQYVPNDGSNNIVESSYGAICNNIASDEGFARAMLYMCEQKSIECYYVDGTYKGTPIAWNIVKVGENYYHLDASYQRIYDTGFQLLSTNEMKELGYAFDESYYPKCTKKFSV